jgi:hypothetical protein
VQPSVGQQQGQAEFPFPPQDQGYGPVPPPRRRRKVLRVVLGLLIVVAVIVAGVFLAPLLMGGGTPDWGSRVTYSRPADPQLGELRVGDFNYINACEVFTPKDYKDKHGGRSDHNVTATFSTRTYGDSDPLRTYQGRCQRGSFDVTIEQFSSKDVQGKTNALLPGFAADEELAQELGDTAAWNGTTRDLKFDMDNKHVFVGYMGDVDSPAADVRADLVEVALSVRSKIEERAASPSKVFQHHPEGAKIGSFQYHSACELFTPDDYRRVLDIEPDGGEVQAQYDQAVRRTQSITDSSCEIDALRPKTAPPDSGGSGESFTNTIAVLRVEQYDAVDFASDNFEADPADGDEVVEGIGDDAFVDPIAGGSMGDGQILKVRKGNVIFDVEVFQVGSAGSPVASDPVQNLKALKKIAKTVVRRLE